MADRSLKSTFAVAAAGTAAMAGALLSPLAYGASWMLYGLPVILPAMWWLMRSVPPKPVVERFPAIRLLFKLQAEDQEPARMPLWQRLIGLSATAMLIGAAAQPQLNPDEPLKGDGPVMLVVDNDWSAARNWEARAAEMESLISRAESEGRLVVILPTAAPEDGGPVRVSGPVDAAEARRIALDMEPQPWPADREASLSALDSLTLEEPASVIWLSNGMDAEGTLDLAQRLQSFGALTVLEDEAREEARLLSLPETAGDLLTVAVRRADGSGEDRLTLTASDESGRAVSKVDVRLESGQTEAEAVFNLPPEVRNQLTRIAIEGESSAGATVLLDERWRRRPVGLVNIGTAESAQPLLDEASFVERALEPYVDLRQGDVEELLERDLAVLILPDAASLDQASRQRIDRWVQDGGTLLRFAGPRLASAETEDNLLPVRLRPGEHSQRGSMTGSGRNRLAPFSEQSPFHGMELPDNVSIDKKVLPQPGSDLEQSTWARLEDGTPLVTGKKRGDGWIVLVHTTANTWWSNLPLSGFFVDMLRTVVAHSQGISGGPDGTDRPLPPLAILDGEGKFSGTPPAVRPLTPEAMDSGIVGPQHPPGFYGDDAGRHAHNLFAAVPSLEPLPDMPDGVSAGAYGHAEEPKDFDGLLLYGAFSLLLVNLLVLMGQQGHLPGIRKESSRIPAPPEP